MWCKSNCPGPQPVVALYSLAADIIYHYFSSANAYVLQKRKRIVINLLDLHCRIQVCKTLTWLKSCIKQSEGISPPFSTPGPMDRYGCSTNLACVCDGTVPTYMVTHALVPSGLGLPSISQMLILQIMPCALNLFSWKPLVSTWLADLVFLHWKFLPLFHYAVRMHMKCWWNNGKKFAISVVMWFDAWVIHWLLPKGQSNLRNMILCCLFCFYRNSVM